MSDKSQQIQYEEILRDMGKKSFSYEGVNIHIGHFLEDKTGYYFYKLPIGIQNAISDKYREIETNKNTEIERKKRIFGE